jgi:glyoxylase-like metal-dependent hydrolase (beta-lactamase superfamily II)
MESAPKLRIPPSSNTVDVSIINTTGVLHGVVAEGFIGPRVVRGHEVLKVPVFSFLIQHRGPGTEMRTVLFDLGIRKDWCNSSPVLVGLLKTVNWTIEVQKGVREILDDGGIDTAAIEAVIISHHHFDHVGDIATFEPSTALIVGPGYTEHMTPGYPANPESVILETDYAGRELRELDFHSAADDKWKTVDVGPFRAIDYFNDGSFYLIDTPGHAIGHISALARVGSSSASGQDSFILMVGDGYHHVGELRPSTFHPLPESISPSPLPTHPGGCSCSVFRHLLRDGVTTPFYDPAAGGWHHDAEEATRTVRKLQELDGQENVLAVAAHDASLLDVVDFFPKKVDAKKIPAWDSESRWKFLGDFAGAVEENKE